MATKKMPGPLQKDLKNHMAICNELKKFNQKSVPAKEAFEIIGRVSITKKLKGAERYRALADRYILAMSTLDVSSRNEDEWVLIVGDTEWGTDSIVEIADFQEGFTLCYNCINILGLDVQCKEILALDVHSLPEGGLLLPIDYMTSYIQGNPKKTSFTEEYEIIMKWMCQYIPDKYIERMR